MVVRGVWNCDKSQERAGTAAMTHPTNSTPNQLWLRCTSSTFKNKKTRYIKILLSMQNLHQYTIFIIYQTQHNAGYEIRQEYCQRHSRPAQGIKSLIIIELFKSIDDSACHTSTWFDKSMFQLMHERCLNLHTPESHQSIVNKSKTILDKLPAATVAKTTAG